MTTPTPGACRHPKPWRHRHYRIAGRRYCRLECACGHVIDEGPTR